MASDITALDGSITLPYINLAYSKPDGISTPSDQLSIQNAYTLKHGAGGDIQADQVYAAQLAIPASGSVTLDLQSLTNRLGGAGNMEIVNTVTLINNSDELTPAPSGSVNLQIGGAVSNQNLLWGADASDLFNLAQGAAQAWVSPSGVAVDSTHKAVKISNPTAWDGQLKVIIVGKNV